jgi:hypothetical protein
MGIMLSPNETNLERTMDYLERLYDAARRQDLDGIEQLLKSAAVSGQNKVNFSGVRWSELVEKEKNKKNPPVIVPPQPVKGETDLLGSGWIRWLGLVLALTLVLFTGLAGGYFLGHNMGGAARTKATPKQTAVMVDASSTPTSTLVAPTATPLTPTESPPPTEILLPTATATPFQIEFSKYSLLPGQSVLYPPVPVLAQAVWLLDAQQASIEPPLSDANYWLKKTSIDAKAGKTAYFVLHQAPITVTWKMDVPLEAGLYQLYVLDTVADSGGTRSFDVLLNGTPVSPFRGRNQVIFNTQAGGQKADEWLSIGSYQVTQGQTLTVQIQVDGISPDMPFALERLLVVRMPPEAAEMLSALPEQRPLVAFMDDDQAVFSGVVSGQYYPLSPNQQPIGQSLGILAWNREMKFIPGPWDREIAVTWPTLGRLAAGEYELQVWIPAEHATAQVDYQLLADGSEVYRDNPASIRQKDNTERWATLGTWRLGAEATVSVRMLVSPQANLMENGDQAQIGVDAVGLVWVGP